MGTWTIHDTRRKTSVVTRVESNAEAIYSLADGHSEKVYAVNDSTHEKLTYDSGFLGDRDTQWDLYDQTGRVITYLSNNKAFMALCRNVMDKDINNDDIWLVKVNDLNQRLRWNTEKDWFEFYTV